MTGSSETQIARRRLIEKPGENQEGEVLSTAEVESLDEYHTKCERSAENHSKQSKAVAERTRINTQNCEIAKA